jgi:hypothetical protein
MILAGKTLLPQDFVTVMGGEMLVPKIGNMKTALLNLRRNAPAGFFGDLEKFRALERLALTK